MGKSVTRSLHFVASLLLVPPPLRAEEPASPKMPAGDTAWALPGIVRVGVPGTPATSFAVAGGAGYGFVESQRSGDGTHHRVLGSAAASVTPVRSLDVALRLDGRYDLHPDDGRGSHGAAVGDPRVAVRYGGPAGDALRLGLQASVWLPGKDAPSIAFDATTVDATGFAAWAPRGGPVVGAMAGYRLDGSANAGVDPDRLRFGDRLSIGLSDFDAVLVGVGAAIPVGATELLAEASGDLLIGAGAPSISQSPLRASVGVRHPVTRALAAEALVDVSLSSRPDLTAGSPLVPIEPRASLVLGLRYRPPFESPGGAAAPAAAPAAAVAPASVAPKGAAVVVRVAGTDGNAVPAAVVSLEIGGWTGKSEGHADGLHRFDDAPLGEGTLSVMAEGFTPIEQPVTVAPGKPEIPIKMEAAPTSGQLRGLIRSFAGKGLAASVRVEPLGTEATTDASGAFTIDVPPGDYEVVIKAERFKEQRRKIHVDLNGVTVINAELFEGK